MTHTAGQTDRYNSRSLVLALLAGPLIWSFYFLIGYTLGEFACKANILTAQVIGDFTILSLIIVVLTLVAFAVTAYAAFWTHRSRQQMREESGGLEAQGRITEGVTQFMLFSGMLLSILFALTILVTGVPILLLEPCRWI